MDEDKISKTIHEIDQKLDRVITAVVSHGETLGAFASKDDLSHLKGEVLDALDKQLVILQRLDQERLYH